MINNMIRNKEDIVRKFCKEVLIDEIIHNSNVDVTLKEDNIITINDGSYSMLQIKTPKIQECTFIKINTHFLLFDKFACLDECACIYYKEYSRKTGIPKIYYGVPNDFLEFLAGYSIGNLFTFNLVQNLYREANIYYSNRFHETGEDSPIKYTREILDMDNVYPTIYCPLSIYNVCHVQESCMSCCFMEKDIFSQNEVECYTEE